VPKAVTNRRMPVVPVVPNQSPTRDKRLRLTFRLYYRRYGKAIGPACVCLRIRVSAHLFNEMISDLDIWCAGSPWFGYI